MKDEKYSSIYINTYVVTSHDNQTNKYIVILLSACLEVFNWSGPNQIYCDAISFNYGRFLKSILWSSLIFLLSFGACAWGLLW